MSTIAPITIGTIVFTQERLETLFTNHPEVDTFYFTIDGLAFAAITSAQQHAQQFRNQNITTINRGDIDYVEPEPVATPVAEVAAPVEPVVEVAKPVEAAPVVAEPVAAAAEPVVAAEPVAAPVAEAVEVLPPLTFKQVAAIVANPAAAITA